MTGNWAIRILVLLALGYLALCLLVFLSQRKLLYHPWLGPPPKADLDAAGLRAWPSAEVLRGFVGREGGEAGTVIVFHGNAGAAWHRDYYVQMLGPLGFRGVLAEYPGYCGRSGKLGERSFVADARETVCLAHQQFGGPVYLCGESLGAGVAAAVAAEAPVPIEGVVMITPWDTLPDLAQTLYPFLPARWLVLDKYDSVRNLSRFDGRVAVAVAEYDEVVPKRHGLRLYESLPGPKRLWIIEGAWHSTWPELVDAYWWQEVIGYLRQTE